MSAAAEAGLRRILAVVDLLIDAVDEETLVPALLPLLLGAVPGDSIIWSPRAGTADRPLTLPAGLLTPDVQAAFAREAAADSLVTHTTLGSGTPMRRSTLQTRAEFHALAAYAEVYRPFGAEQQLAMSFPAGYAAGRPRKVCVAISRSGSDFSDDDVAAAALLRTRLNHVLHRLAPPTPPPSLVTRRESAVLALLARGLTNQQIARRLEISPRTVDKHLEHAYAKLRVSSRVEAANAWLTRGRTAVPLGP
ncbi:response regulator transcription factor [Streptomyces sp. RPA4-5]|uniref:helix-turn-helix transcriptional regulator n=1 Tax=Streptomyces TaxID=1883 RepID=UPI00143E5065|nr:MULTISPECIES: LuxR C-terminal-related transcriptional regulator [Streptomyces]MCX4638182.1 LuxR C-terminal-related transcriptional regulator [Streptomyces platensis]QIY54604.1 response regulator transcription factor [Streptomyces sp. RPA4-5]WJY37246.1 LuxR C-terminal-related transcriptional regulator [Streptomyces sp. P9-2B-2]